MTELWSSNGCTVLPECLAPTAEPSRPCSGSNGAGATTYVPVDDAGSEERAVVFDPRARAEEGGQRWLVAPYGELGWVRNTRAAGQVTLSRGRHAETMAIVEAGPEESAPVLRHDIAEVPISRPYFDVRPDSPLDAFRTEAPRHPVFRIVGNTNRRERIDDPYSWQ